MSSSVLVNVSSLAPASNKSDTLANAFCKSSANSTKLSVASELNCLFFSMRKVVSPLARFITFSKLIRNSEISSTNLVPLGSFNLILHGLQG